MSGEIGRGRERWRGGEIEGVRNREDLPKEGDKKIGERSREIRRGRENSVQRWAEREGREKRQINTEGNDAREREREKRGFEEDSGGKSKGDGENGHGAPCAPVSRIPLTEFSPDYVSSRGPRRPSEKGTTELIASLGERAHYVGHACPRVE